MAKKHSYESEAALCAAFMQRARDLGWRAYPENKGWDILLEATEDVVSKHVRVGDQIGVQAKLLANVKVLSQAMPSEFAASGPNFHAVLVPYCTSDFLTVARRLQVLVFTTHDQHGRELLPKTRIEVKPSIRFAYDKPLWHPNMEVNVAAGSKSPRSVSPWKVNAVRLVLKGREGPLIEADFKEVNHNKSMWVQRGWIRPTGEKRGRYKVYAINKEHPMLPDKQWPEILEALTQSTTP